MTPLKNASSSRTSLTTHLGNRPQKQAVQSCAKTASEVGRKFRSPTEHIERVSSHPSIGVFFLRFLLLAVVIFHFIPKASSRPFIAVAPSNPSPAQHCSFGMRCV